MMSCIKVLHVIGFLGKGGDSTAVINVMNYLEKNNSGVKFDFLTYKRFDKDTFDFVKKNHNVFVLDNHLGVKHPLKFYKELKKILLNNNYDAIHFHTSFQSCIGLFVAKRCKVPVRVCHSHTTAVQRRISVLGKKFILPFCRFIINKCATKKVACSRGAGEFLFGKNVKFDVVYNGLNLKEERKINKKIVSDIKDKYHIDDSSVVVGQVGRFDDNKNQRFVIELAKLLDSKKFIFLLLGDGPNYDDIKLQAKKEQLDNVHFVGYVANVKDYMSLFNYMLQPSKYGEGLPVTLIEQQIINSNCICLSSDIITFEANLGNVIYLSLNDIDSWINIIKNGTKVHSLQNIQLFDIANSAEIWLSLYK